MRDACSVESVYQSASVCFTYRVMLTSVRCSRINCPKIQKDSSVIAQRMDKESSSLCGSQTSRTTQSLNNSTTSQIWFELLLDICKSKPSDRCTHIQSICVYTQPRESSDLLIDFKTTFRNLVNTKLT